MRLPMISDGRGVIEILRGMRVTEERECPKCSGTGTYRWVGTDGKPRQGGCFSCLGMGTQQVKDVARCKGYMKKAQAMAEAHPEDGSWFTYMLTAEPGA